MLPFSYKLQRIFYRSSENELGVDHILMYEPLRPSAQALLAPTMELGRAHYLYSTTLSVRFSASYSFTIGTKTKSPASWPANWMGAY